MAKGEYNRSAELETFVKVVEQGSFSAAARHLNLTPSSISKTITRLEQRLGARLFNRSTRSLELTSEGCTFYERGVRIIADLNEAEQLVCLQKSPTGRIRVNCNIPFGKKYILPLLPKFLEKYPDVTLDIELTDQVVNLLEERTDIAIRSGKLQDSSLISRMLGTSRMVVVASPEYLKHYGEPKCIEDYTNHNLLSFTFLRSVREWPFHIENKELTVSPNGNIKVSDGDSLRHLVLSGTGIGRLAYFQVKDDIESGKLKILMDSFTNRYTESIYAVYVGQGGILPLRIRAFVDFLVEQIDVV
ncbi:LysR family transcriptional regulator [uncultured Paraglaciecola sp.]|uniref:LysR family transcriptional regulator n=1 Tax=uncultured Paraglaciecola sp. TaxID=1765024 RepID=UPI0025941F35|nr:LysR family transcriptional regulator [uncultured Paraglaciecola sp.]